MKFTEAKLEQVFIELLENEGYPHFVGSDLQRSDASEVHMQNIVQEMIEYFLDDFEIEE